MTREAIQQLAAAERERYRRATREEKHGILEHFCAATGFGRKSALRLLRSRPTRVSGRQGRPSIYGAEFVAGPKVAWEATICVYCKGHGITLTRSRPYKKNDQARVEQKNWSVVRKLVGYDRYNSRASLAALEDLYTLIRLHVNFFQPICKLVSSHREGTRVQKQFDRGQTPYQRLLASGSLSQKQRQALKAIYDDLNPVQLCAEIETAQQRLWQLAQPDMRTSKENRILAAIDGQMPVATRAATDQPGNSTSEATTSLR